MELICSYRPIVDYIDTQFENYLQEELKIRRSLFDYHDTRIHVCLYFITPTGHSLKSLDLVTMKKLDSKVRPVPRALWVWPVSPIFQLYCLLLLVFDQYSVEFRGFSNLVLGESLLDRAVVGFTPSFLACKAW